ncbi:MAG: hypothetical protein JO194_04040 [Candidatus Eremiobacteraeota bacterium]|nr:hypothetical protein [Candidatus Eremiobacteraeota bacterium]
MFILRLFPAFFMSAAVTLPGVVAVYTPPPVYQLTFKKIDLTIGGVNTLPIPSCTGNVPVLRFVVTVKNIGKLDYSPAPANQALELKGPSHTQFADLPFISAGGNGKVLFVYTPQTESATYPNTTFTFVVNPNRRISESDYSNNSFTEKLALKPPFCPGPAATANATPAH